MQDLGEDLVTVLDQLDLECVLGRNEKRNAVLDILCEVSLNHA